MKLRYIVTGGAGFIGSRLIEYLVRNEQSENHTEVQIIDDFSLGTSRNIKSLMKDNNLRSTIKQINEKYDFVIHLGMPSSSPMYREDRKLISKVVSDGIDVLEYCKTFDVPLVFASTSSLYNGNVPPFSEAQQIQVTDFYTEARYSLERIAEAYSKIYDIKAIGLRLFSVYGENEHHKGKYANLVYQFFNNVLNDESPTIYGDGSQTRDLIYVNDVVKCILKAVKYVEKESKCFEIINVGTGIETSLNELVKSINRLLGKQITPKYIENPLKNYVQRTMADTGKMKKYLDPEPLNKLDDGLQILKKLIV